MKKSTDGMATVQYDGKLLTVPEHVAKEIYEKLKSYFPGSEPWPKPKPTTGSGAAAKKSTTGSNKR